LATLCDTENWKKTDGDQAWSGARKQTLGVVGVDGSALSQEKRKVRGHFPRGGSWPHKIGLTIYRPVANISYDVCVKNSDTWLVVDKVIAIIIHT